MRRRMLATLVLSLGLTFTSVREVSAEAGSLDSPSIAIPSDGANGTANATAKRFQEILLDHRDRFVSGFFVNAHSALNFSGDAKQLGALLHKLAEVEGGSISIRFAQEPTSPGDKGCQWSIDHNAWGNVESLAVTIYLADKVIRLDELDLPEIHGAKRPAQNAKP